MLVTVMLSSTYVLHNLSKKRETGVKLGVRGRAHTQDVPLSSENDVRALVSKYNIFPGAHQSA